MNRLTPFLENSRLAAVIGQVERGEAVDYPHVLALQALDIGRIGELFALDTIEAEVKADDDFEQRLNAS